MGPKRQTKNKGKGKAPLVIPPQDQDTEDADMLGLMKGAGVLDLANLTSINEIEQADDSKMELEEEGFEGEDEDDEESEDDDEDSLDEWMEEDDDEDEMVDDDEITYSNSCWAVRIERDTHWQTFAITGHFSINQPSSVPN